MMSIKPATASESGFSLVEVMVALSVITVGIIGTISMVSANRALMETSWAQARMIFIADSVMSELAVQFQQTGTLPITADYDWSNDPDDFGAEILFSDNGYTASASELSIVSGVAPVTYVATLRVVSPSGRRMTRTRNFFRKLSTD